MLTSRVPVLFAGRNLLHRFWSSGILTGNQTPSSPPWPSAAGFGSPSEPPSAPSSLGGVRASVRSPRRAWWCSPLPCPSPCLGLFAPFPGRDRWAFCAWPSDMENVPRVSFGATARKSPPPSLRWARVGSPYPISMGGSSPGASPRG